MRAKTLGLAEARLSGRRKPISGAPLSPPPPQGSREPERAPEESPNPVIEATGTLSLSYPPLPLPAGAGSSAARAAGAGGGETGAGDEAGGGW